MGYAITRKGQVTLPKQVRERLGVAPGGQIALTLRVVGGLTTDEIMAMTRGDDR